MTDKDVQFERQLDVDPKVVARMSEEIIMSLDGAGFLPMTQFSIVTTAFMHLLKRQIKDSPPPFFNENKITALAVLNQLRGEVEKMKPPGGEDARNSQDGKDTTGQDRKTN